MPRRRELTESYLAPVVPGETCKIVLERIAELAVRNGRLAHEPLTFDREEATRGLMGGSETTRGIPLNGRG
jgi:hypothetical protein